MKKAWILGSLGAFLLLILVIGAILPSLASTQWGKEKVLKKIYNQKSGELKASSLSLSWFGPQQIQGIEFFDRQKNISFTCPTIQTTASLWRILAKRDVGVLEIVQPQAKISLPTPSPSLASSTPSTPASVSQAKSARTIPFTGEMKVSKGSLDIQNVRFDDLLIDICITPDRKNLCTLVLEGKTTQDQISGNFRVQGHVDLTQETGEIHAKLLHFPISGVDKLAAVIYPELSGLLIGAIGPSFDLDLNATKLPGSAALNVKASSAYLNADIDTLSQNGALSLKAPASIRLIVTPLFAQKLASLSLTQNLTAQLTIQQLSIPIAHPEQLAIQANVSLSPGVLSPSISLDAFQGTLSAKDLSQSLDIWMNGKFRFNDLAFLGNSMDLTGKGAWKKGTLQMAFSAPTLFNADLTMQSREQIALQVKTDKLSAQLTGAYKDNRLFITKPLTIQGNLTNDQLQKISPSLPPLAQEAPFDMRIDPFSFSLAEPLLTQVKTKAEMKIKQLALISPNPQTQASLSDLLLQLQFDGKKGAAFASLFAKTVEKGGIDLNLSLDHLILKETIDSSQATCSLNADLQSLPTSLVEAWFDGKYSLADALGPTITLHFKGLSSPQNQSFSLLAQSQFLNADLAFAIKQGMLVLQSAQKPGKIDFTLTQKGYQLLTQISADKAPFELNAPSRFLATVSTVKWPVTLSPNPKSLSERIPSFQAPLAAIEMQGDLSVDTFSLKEKTSGRVANLSNMRLKFAKAGLKDPVSFNLQALVSSQAAKPGSIAVDGKLENLFSEQGEFQSNSMKAHIAATMQNLPSLLLDVLNSKTSWSKLFGETLNASLNTDIQKGGGSLQANVNSPNTRVSIKGAIQNGILTLSEPIYAQLTMNPEVGALLMEHVNPLSLSHLSAKNPLTLEIDPKGFSMPLFPFNINQTNIPNARLELGQMTCKNEGNLNITLGLLKSRLLSQEKDLKLWFAPMDMHLKNGLLDIERTEILVSNTFDIAIWGKIDFVKDYVDMVLGLTADCLSAAFGIKGLPSNYVLQVPMQGPTSNVKINKTKATTKIAALLAWQQKILSDALGKGGGVFGQLLGRVASLPDLNSPAPPAKRPFPWEAEKAAKKKTSHKKNEIKPKDKPLKQALKVLKS